MKTFIIDIPDQIYERGIKYANVAGITFSELCSLGVMELLKCNDDELEEVSSNLNFDKNEQD